MSKKICGFVMALTLGWVAVGSVAAQAQTKPKIIKPVHGALARSICGKYM